MKGGLFQIGNPTVLICEVSVETQVYSVILSLTNTRTHTQFNMLFLFNVIIVIIILAEKKHISFQTDQCEVLLKINTSKVEVF